MSNICLIAHWGLIILGIIFALFSGSHIVPVISGKWKYYLITCLQTFKINLVIWIVKRFSTFFHITNLRMTNLVTLVGLNDERKTVHWSIFSVNLVLRISKYSWIIHGKGPRQESLKGSSHHALGEDFPSAPFSKRLSESHQTSPNAGHTVMCIHDCLHKFCSF